MKPLTLLAILLSFCISIEAVSELTIIPKKISVLGQEATVLSIADEKGHLGLWTRKGDTFDVVLHNPMDVPTSIHWHGLVLPNDQDGVAFITQFPLFPKQSYHYQFPLVQEGTYWMHSHFALQEQNLLSAPLIIYGPDDERMADQEVVLFLADFSFRSPNQIFDTLKNSNRQKEMKMPIKKDIVEVDYDAFLTNYRTLDNPDVAYVMPGDRVRLRIINGASATNFFIDLGSLEGVAIAVDGNRIQPLKGSQFELGVANRIDLIVTIPDTGSVFPILAQGEGTDKQTGLILALNGAEIPKISHLAKTKALAFTNRQESLLSALNPLPKQKIDRKLNVVLGGNMKNYTWTLNGQAWPEVTPLVVTEGERVEISFKNETSMSHPMHLHGHVFQVLEIDGKPLQGALRDTVLVMPNSTLKIQFDANNPGVWPLHCHILYHLEAGMLTVLRYNDFIQPLSPIKSLPK